MNTHRGSRPVVGRLLAAYGCAAVATGLPWPLLLVLVWDQYGAGPHGSWAVGLAGAARMAPYVLLSWAVGSLGDHVRRDRLIRATMALRLVFLAAAGVALADDRVGLGVLAAALAVAVGTPAYPAIAASLPGLAGARRARATEALVTIEVSSWVIGPALGGLLLAESMRPWTLPVAVALALAGLALSAGISVPGPAEKAPDAVAGMLRLVLRSRPALGALGLAGVLNLVATITGVVLLPLSTESWGRGDAGFGLATACLGFGALGAPMLGRLVTITCTRGMLALAGSVLVVALSPVPWPALPLLALAGALGVVIESLLTGTLQDAVPDRYRAGALGLADTIMVGACLVGSLVAPALAKYAGARPALLVVALAALLPVLAVRLLPYTWARTPYDATDERTEARPDPRGAPAVGATRLG
jgi:MFS family permease